MLAWMRSVGWHKTRYSDFLFQTFIQEDPNIRSIFVIFQPQSLRLERATTQRPPESSSLGMSKSVTSVEMNTGGSAVHRRECIICAESKIIFRNFPSPTTCSHDEDTCVTCYLRQATVIVEEHRRWEALTCPACNATLPKEELEAAIPRTDAAAQAEIKRLDSIVKTHALIQSPYWRWCPLPGCGNGQIHYPGPERIACLFCGGHSCFRHQMKWHEGYTCDQYDMVSTHVLSG